MAISMIAMTEKTVLFFISFLRKTFFYARQRQAISSLAARRKAAVFTTG
jgi:hypothetical protein